MKILVLIEIASLGGHVLSAFNTATELARRDHCIVFAGGDGPMKKDISSKFNYNLIDYFYNFGSKQTYFRFKSFHTIKQIEQIVLKEQIDHIHAFDARSFVSGTMVSIKLRIPITCTLCGGITPYDYIPHADKLIVFSKEQRRKLIQEYSWKEKNIAVISNRLNMEQFKNIDTTEAQNICLQYGIDPDAFNIVMITNFLDTKKKAILFVLNTLVGVLAEQSHVNLIFIGERGDFYNEAKLIGEKINKNIGRRAIVFTGAIKNAQRLLIFSDIVLGVGRSAFEGMAHHKPTMIIGENGYAGTASEERIKDIAYYNFSGRNINNNNENLDFINEIQRLLFDKTYYDKIKSFGNNFLKEHIDVCAGVGKIELVYECNHSYATSGKKIFRYVNWYKIVSSIILGNYIDYIKSNIKKILKR